MLIEVTVRCAKIVSTANDKPPTGQLSHRMRESSLSEKLFLPLVSDSIKHSATSIQSFWFRNVVARWTNGNPTWTWCIFNGKIFSASNTQQINRFHYSMTSRLNDFRWVCIWLWMELEKVLLFNRTHVLQLLLFSPTSQSSGRTRILVKLYYNNEEFVRRARRFYVCAHNHLKIRCVTSERSDWNALTLMRKCDHFVCVCERECGV